MSHLRLLFLLATSLLVSNVAAKQPTHHQATIQQPAEEPLVRLLGVKHANLITDRVFKQINIFQILWFCFN
ncbi:hypothetical protein [Janthinobacterium sp. B9-8]|uniref:hypothetical protein n=1 Tax=Janthinobacterium sp. B9-8 TaxID=1236179 RepID=UPI00061D1ACD|nr:hypothetical protein [Janthinobacterium sp. B9-8]AMC34716.1 hypothetical protein VN23_08895 [Janthinobacterium sp. B9-8]